MKTFFFCLVIPAFLAAYFFSFCNGAFADAHHLHNLYVTLGWVFTVWVAGFAALWFINPSK